MPEAKCAFCLEELRDGATVCHACAREQPAARAARTQRLLTYVLLGVLIVGVGGWFVWSVVDQQARAQAVDRIVECVHLHGDQTITADFVNYEINEGMTQTGKGWRAGAEYAGLVFLKSGLPDTGACFSTQETLFSN